MAKKASFSYIQAEQSLKQLAGQQLRDTLGYELLALSAVMEMQAFNGSLTVKAMKQRMAVHSLSRKKWLTALLNRVI